MDSAEESACGQRMAVADGKDVVLIEMAETDSGGHRVLPLRFHDERVRSLALAKKGASLISGGGDDTVRAWDTECLMEAFRRSAWVE